MSQLWLAVLLIFVGFAYVIGQSLIIKKAWKEAAAKMGFSFKSSLWLPSIQMEGVVDGFRVTVKYITIENKTWSEGRTKYQRTHYTRFYVTHDKLPRDLMTTHPQNKECAVSGGNITYPDISRFNLLESLFNIGGKKHFYSADKIVAAVQFMVNWGRELIQSR